MNVSFGFEYATAHGVTYTFSKKLAKSAHHGATQRHGGVSEGPLSSLNLGWNRPESKQNIKENYKRLSAAANFDYESMVLTNYCHGDNIIIVDSTNRGAGFDKEPLEHCDGLVTKDTNVTLITLFADCNPLFFCEPKAGIIGVCHAGWKGTSLKVGGKMVKTIVALGGQAKNIIAAVGPSICQNCFEVDEDVRDIFISEFPKLDIIKKYNNKYHIDLWKATAFSILEQGVLPHNITISGDCTMENSSDYFSHRRDSKHLGSTGAMAAFITLPRSK